MKGARGVKGARERGGRHEGSERGVIGAGGGVKGAREREGGKA